MTTDPIPEVSGDGYTHGDEPIEWPIIYPRRVSPAMQKRMMDATLPPKFRFKSFTFKLIDANGVTVTVLDGDA